MRKRKTSDLAINDNYIQVQEKKISSSTLRFGRTKKLRIEQSRGQCSYIKADCRRYAWPFEKVDWTLPYGENYQFAKVSIDTLPYTEMAIEDMCPFAYEAAVEGPINTRLGGVEPGIKKYGLPKNTPLLEALRPYMAAATAKGAKLE